MATNEAKVTFLAETQEFRENVKQASSKLTELRTELRLNAEQMKTNGVTAEGLSDKHRLLQEQLEQAETKTKNLVSQMESCVRLYGENSSEAQKLATQINNARIAEEKIKQEINNVNVQLSNQATESRQAETALSGLESTISDQEAELTRLKNAYKDAALTYGVNSREARELGSEISNLSSELQDNRSKINSVENAANNLDNTVDDAGEAARDASDGFTVFKGALANLVSSGIQSAISGIKEIGSTLWNLGDETREYRTEMGKLDAAFSASGFSAETATSTYRSLYGVIGETDQSVEAAQQIALLSNNTEDAAHWADLAAGVVGRFGDALQPETFFEAANETLKLGEATGAYTQMLEGCGMSVDEFNAGLAACHTEEEKQAYMLKVTETALGDAGAAYRENNDSIIAANEAQDTYNSKLAGLGEIIEPIKTAFVNGMSGMLDAVTQLVSGIDTEAIIAGIQSAFDYITGTVFPAIQTGIQWFIDNKDLVITGISAIVAGIAAFKVVTIVQKAVGVFKAFQAATQGLTIAQTALNVVMSMNPIGLIVAAIAGLIAAFVALWHNCDGFRNFWIGLWESIKSAASAAWSFISGVFSGAWEAIKAVWSAAAPFFTGIWEGIKAVFSVVKQWFSAIFSAAWAAVKAAWSIAVSFFKTIWENIKAVFSVVKTVLGGFFSTAWAAIKAVWDTVTGYFKAIWDTIKGIFSVVKNVLTGNWRDAWNGIKGIVGTWKGYFVGVWNSIKNVFGNVKTWFRDTFRGAWEAVKSVFSGWGDFFGGLWTTIKNKFSAIGTSIANAISGAVKSGINGVISAIERTINSGIRLINGAIGLINLIPGVNIGKIGEVNFPRLARGGVVYGPTLAEIGEYSGASRNPEIVTPQKIMRETFEEALNAHFDNNLNLDRMAAAIEKLASRAIEIDIDGMRIARATAGASDNVSGNRLNLKNRGLAL